jgi:hypothetical protein
VREYSHENFIIFTNKAQTDQKWFFVWRDPGKTIRAHIFEPNSDLRQRLSQISFSLDEEEDLSPIEVLSRIRSSFDVDKVTKSFYEQFKKEHTALLKFIKGIPDGDLQEWYVSVTLNRLMFVYFIQKKGFLDHDQNYLRSKLEAFMQKGTDRYYHDFLCPLFFNGFAVKERNAETRILLGDVPYLNGGIFQQHQIEQMFGQRIQIPDKAFVHLFEFFDEYRWHLDDSITAEENEINPDVLGYIFEKYINQKQMGAYYTKEDITGYISRNSIIPWLFDQAQKECNIAFERENLIRNILQKKENLDRYIYPAMRKGCNLRLPDDIEIGVDDVSQRLEWNNPTDEDYGLPTEIWRETVARRQRYQDIKGKLERGEVCEISDFITLNLNIELFAQDVIQNAEDPELIRAFWKALTTVKILDPTVGSGAFLFAAMNILEPLYEDCIEQMEHFVSLLGADARADKLKDFNSVLAQLEHHANPKYFIYKTITIQNLYGVDIMEEAVETCKLRLFLKLVSQVEQRHNLEPLPDIDFNIRAGNALVGFTSLKDVGDVLSKNEKVQDGDKQYKKVALILMDEENAALKRIEKDAKIASKAFNRFQEMQIEEGINSIHFQITKTDLQERLDDLNEELNQALALSYGVNSENKEAYIKWKTSHQPFHWCVDFYNTIHSGGFDVVIGNPPYVGYSKVRKKYKIQNYKTEPCGNLYAFVIENIKKIIKNDSYIGMIIPISAFANNNMELLRNHFVENYNQIHIASYHQRPAQLFDGVLQRLSIFIATNNNKGGVFTTNPIRWYTNNRNYLFELVFYTNSFIYPTGALKIGSNIELSIFLKIKKHTEIYSLKGSKNDKNYIHYRTAGGGYWWTFLLNKFNTLSLSNKKSNLKKHVNPAVISSILNSSLFWWFYFTHYDLFNLKDYMIFSFPFSYPSKKNITTNLGLLGKNLEEHYIDNAEEYIIQSKTRGNTTTFRYNNRKSKVIIDEIDNILGKYYGFTDEELDFILNYNIKYRMGNELENYVKQCKLAAADHNMVINYSGDKQVSKDLATAPIPIHEPITKELQEETNEWYACRCLACNKMIMSYGRQEHIDACHGGINPGFERLER